MMKPRRKLAVSYIYLTEDTDPGFCCSCDEFVLPELGLSAVMQRFILCEGAQQASEAHTLESCNDISLFEIPEPIRCGSQRRVAARALTSKI